MAVGKTRSASISHNTLMHRGVRVLVKPLVVTPVTPNHLTTLRLVTGLGAAGAFAVGASPWQYYGAAAFVLSVLLDRADGELARLGGKMSPSGHVYDLVADAVSDILVFVGIGIGLRDSILGLWAVPMDIAGGGSVAIIFWLIMRIEERAGARAAELGGVAGFDPDDAILVVPVAMAAGGAVPLLIAATVGAPAFALYFSWRFRRILRSHCAPARAQKGPRGPQATDHRPESGGGAERTGSLS